MLTVLPDATLDIVFRLGLAMLAGMILGLNRWLHHKSAGVRTHSLVSLGAAVAMILVESHVGSDAQSHSRVIQGLVTGIGFLGAGVIIRENSRHIHGLTTAASIWACAMLGAAAGAGNILLGGLALAAIMITLILGGPMEVLMGRLLGVRSSNGVSEKEHDA